jgi:phosphatidylglycerophosphate synthase
MASNPMDPGSKRVQESFLAPIEKKVLLWLAARMPRWINSDHLTLIGLLSMFLAGLSYIRAEESPAFLFLASFFIVLNWFGDSLDGTLARYRQTLRPRYGYYVDHIVDAFGTLFLIGGLGLSSYMDLTLSLLLIIAYFLMSIQIYLATNVFQVFQISFWKISPTEIRIGLIVANGYVYIRPTMTLLGEDRLFFDMVGFASIAVMLLVLVVTTVRNTARLYREEKI